MSDFDHLLHQEAFDTMLWGDRVATRLDERAEDALGDEVDYTPDLSVIIRTKNDRGNIEKLFEEIHRQQYAGNVQVVLVDTESTDGTPEYARRHGAVVRNITQAEFTYPLSLNRGMEAAEGEYAFMTVGHANFTNTATLQAIARHARPGVGGVYGLDLPSLQASRTEKLLYGVPQYKKLGPASEQTDMVIGVMGATVSAARKEAWEAVGGFDLRYAAGSEDLAFARTLRACGLTIVRDPALSMHHSHGLGPVDFARQMLHWREINGKPLPFDAEAVHRRRPDLRQKAAPRNG